jgi:HK97 family phage prohead protease
MSTIEKPGASRVIQPASDLRIMTCRVRGIEVRDSTATSDGSWTMSGYAAVFDTDSVIYDGAYWQMVESIDPHAFDRVLTEPGLLTHFNFGHDMNRVMASTDVPAGQVGSLGLRADPQQGLFFLARVDPEDPDAQALAVKMRSGVIAGASFAFTIARKQLTTTDMEDGREQDYVRILEVGELYDVCACAQGAYPTASSQISARSYGSRILGLGAAAKRTDLNQPDPEDEGETFGTDLAEAIEALSDLIADGYDLSMPADETAGTTVGDEVAGCIGYLSDVLGQPDQAGAAATNMYAKGQPAPAGGRRDQPGSGGREDVSPARGGVPTPTHDDELEALRRRAAIARHSHRKVDTPCP